MVLIVSVHWLCPLKAGCLALAELREKPSSLCLAARQTGTASLPPVLIQLHPAGLQAASTVAKSAEHHPGTLRHSVHIQTAAMVVVAVVPPEMPPTVGSRATPDQARATAAGSVDMAGSFPLILRDDSCLFLDETMPASHVVTLLRHKSCRTMTLKTNLPGRQKLALRGPNLFLKKRCYITGTSPVNEQVVWAPVRLVREMLLYRDNERYTSSTRYREDDRSYDRSYHRSYHRSHTHNHASDARHRSRSISSSSRTSSSSRGRQRHSPRHHESRPYRQTQPRTAHREVDSGRNNRPRASHHHHERDRDRYPRADRDRDRSHHRER